MSIARIALLFALAIAGLFILVSCEDTTYYTFYPEPNTQEASTSIKESALKQDDPEVRERELLAAYEKVKLGMTKAEVIAILGKPSHRLIAKKKYLLGFYEAKVATVLKYDIGKGDPGRYMVMKGIELWFRDDGQLFFAGACFMPEVKSLGEPLH